MKNEHFSVVWPVLPPEFLHISAGILPKLQKTDLQIILNYSKVLSGWILAAHTIKSDFKSFLVQKEYLSKTLRRYYLRIVVMARRHVFLLCSQIHSRQFKFIPLKFKNHRAATVRGKKPHDGSGLWFLKVQFLVCRPRFLNLVGAQKSDFWGTHNLKSRFFGLWEVALQRYS